MSDLFGIVPLGQHGGKRPGAGRPRKGEVRPPKQKPRNLIYGGSTSPSYITARLARDAQLGCREAAILLEAIFRNLISPHTAGCEMSYTKRAPTNGRGSENMARKRDWTLHKLLDRPAPKA